MKELSKRFWKTTLGMAAIAGALWACGPAQADVLTVTSSGDNNNDPTTLRSAINKANQDPPGDVIDLSNISGSTITLLNGELVINNRMTIAGPGAASVSIVSANGRVFNIIAAALAFARRCSGTVLNGHHPSNPR